VWGVGLSDGTSLDPICVLISVFVVGRQLLHSCMPHGPLNGLVRFCMIVAHER
jgi:hypothetical protein